MSEPVRIDDYLRPSESRLPIEFAEDIDFDPLAIHEIVEDVFGARRMSVTYGESNSGKTTLMLDLAFRMPSGLPWLGKRVEPSAVIYVAAESPNSVQAAQSSAHTVCALPKGKGITLCTGGTWCKSTRSRWSRPVSVRVASQRLPDQAQALNGLLRLVQRLKGLLQGSPRLLHTPARRLSRALPIPSILLQAHGRRRQVACQLAGRPGGWEKPRTRRAT